MFTAAQIVLKIFEEYRRRRPVSASSASTSASSSINKESLKLVQQQLGISKNILMQNLKTVYGEKWIQSRATVLKPINAQAEELYTRLVYNLPNEPTYENVAVQKKNIITQWKEMYEKQFRRLAWANKGEAVMNFASTRKADGKFPTVAEIKERLKRLRVAKVEKL
jgi:hypothetical protein